MACGLFNQQLHLPIHVQRLLVGEIIACTVSRKRGREREGGGVRYWKMCCLFNAVVEAGYTPVSQVLV